MAKERGVGDESGGWCRQLEGTEDEGLRTSAALDAEGPASKEGTRTLLTTEGGARKEDG